MSTSSKKTKKDLNKKTPSIDTQKHSSSKIKNTGHQKKNRATTPIKQTAQRKHLGIAGGNNNKELVPENLINPDIPCHKPEILAPAGDMHSALAAFAAGADAVYLGLKHFSARMQAENFSTTELGKLTDFAHTNGRKVFVAMNTVVKPQDSPSALRLIKRLALDVQPDALIIQDLGLIELARQADFKGELHISTLGNLTHQHGLTIAKQLGANRVILPRELSLAEVQAMNQACPDGVSLELFVHGALCYCVSGRCWWSSYMGGKSGLRGRCVQPCRRVYKQKGREGRFFSSLDLSLDAVVQHLLPLNNLRSWKIEGRRKSPHYVYHVTSAYHLLREEGHNPAARREAARLLEFSLGRESTSALFLSNKGNSLPGAESSGKKNLVPITSREGQTNSGLLCGKISKNLGRTLEFRPRFPLIPKDYLRIGYEDEPWHNLIAVPKNAPQDEPYSLIIRTGQTPPLGTPVFLIDRKEQELSKLLAEWEKRLANHPYVPPKHPDDITSLMPLPYAREKIIGRQEIIVYSSLPQGKEAKADLRPGTMLGLWLSPKALSDLSRTMYKRISWWLPPVIWPNEDGLWARTIREAIRGGAKYFVCNAPWQISYFSQLKGLHLTAGPFCNITNAQTVYVLKNLGFSAVMLSPELGQEDILSMPGQSVLPMGMIISGYWPMGISRHQPSILKMQESMQSPKGEEFWMRRYGQNTWIYPGWPLDLSNHLPSLQRAGFSTFVHLSEHPPKNLLEPKRTSEFNWVTNVL